MSQDQPDGIEDDSTDLPDPLKAAERVNAFLSAYGDGLIVAEWLPEYLPPGGQPPLYARDLAALTDLAEELARVKAVVADFCAEREQFITAINNCHPDNNSDYYRWQGGAEARRQLSERLGLPVAWPAEYKDRKVAR